MTLVFSESETGLSVTDGKNFTWANLIERETSPIAMSGIITKVNQYYFSHLNSQNTLENIKLNSMFLKDQHIIAIFEHGFIKTINDKGIIRYYKCS